MLQCRCPTNGTLCINGLIISLWGNDRLCNDRTRVIYLMFNILHCLENAFVSCRLLTIGSDGGGENAGVENAGVENAAPSSKGGKRCHLVPRFLLPRFQSTRLWYRWSSTYTLYCFTWQTEVSAHFLLTCVIVIILVGCGKITGQNSAPVQTLVYLYSKTN